MFEKKIIRGYDYTIDISNDMDAIRDECKKECKDSLPIPFRCTDIKYMGMLGSRIVIGVPKEIFEDKLKSTIVVNTIGKTVYIKHGTTYGIELIPNEKSEIIMNVLRKGFDIENIIISEMRRETEVKTETTAEKEEEYTKPAHSIGPFVIGDHNRMAYQAAWEVINNPGGAYNPFYIYGGPSVGKTQLLNYIGDHISQKNPDAKVIYVTSEDFTNDVIEAIRSGDQSVILKMRDRYRTADVLIVDDIEYFIGKDVTQEEFFNTFNTLHLAGKQIILSSDKPPKAHENLDERFRSRFSMGLVVDIPAPDYEIRKVILEQWCEDANIDVGLLADVVKKHDLSIREMKGAFNKLVALSKQKVEVTADNIEFLLDSFD